MSPLAAAGACDWRRGGRNSGPAGIGGLAKLAPTLVGFAGYAVALALREIEVGVAYAIWSALGTTLVVVGGLVLFDESMTVLRLASLGIVVVGVVGVRLSA